MITVAQAKQFIEDENLDPIKERSDDKFSIHSPFVADNRWRCGFAKKGNEVVFNDFVACGHLGQYYKGHFFQFVKLVKDFKSISEAKRWFIKKYIGFKFYENEKPIVEEKKTVVEFPDRFERFNKEKHPEYYEYLKERMVTDSILQNHRIFIDEHSKRIVFPTYRNNQIVSYNARAIDDHPIRWLKPKGQGIHPIWNLDRTAVNCYIFEGIMDAIMVRNGVALQTSQFNDNYAKQILDKQFNRIVIIMDGDTAGTNARKHIAEWLSKHHDNVWVYNWDGIKHKDFNEMAIAGIDFDMQNRIEKWSKATALKMNMGAIK